MAIRQNIGPSIGMVRGYVYGEEKIKNMSLMVDITDKSKSKIAASVVPYVIEKISGAVPEMVKEKILVDAEPVGEGRYRVHFYSRGEPDWQVNRKIFDKQTQKIITVRNAPGLDLTIDAILEEELDKANEEFALVLNSIADVTIWKIAKALGLKMKRSGKKGVGFYLEHGGVVGGSTYGPGSYIAYSDIRRAGMYG